MPHSSICNEIHEPNKIDWNYILMVIHGIVLVLIKGEIGTVIFQLWAWVQYSMLAVYMLYFYFWCIILIEDMDYYEQGIQFVTRFPNHVVMNYHSYTQSLTWT